MPKRALIITYYWPPSGGSGVQRWLKFCKYLTEFGWEPVIYTPSNPEVSVLDVSLVKDLPNNLEVIKSKIFEPYSIFRLVTGKRSNMGVGFTSPHKSKNGLINRISLWLRANLFIPDARMLWIKPSVRYLTRYLSASPVDVVITTGPPHSMHLIGLDLKKRLGVKWLADFRDPWTNIDYFGELPLTKCSLKKHQALEQEVICNADKVVVVSTQMQKEFTKFRTQGVELITNGYDEDDFPEIENYVIDSAFTITHIGSIPPNRNNKYLWQAISNLVNADSDFAAKLKIQLVGSVDSSVIDQIDQVGLSSHCQMLGYLNHTDSIRLMQRSQVLLLLINQSPNAKGILTGKVFEYLAAKRPILAIGPTDSDVQRLLQETQSGELASFDSLEHITSIVRNIWISYLKGFQNFNSQSVESYSRRGLTRKMVDILSQIEKS
jgi:hypothetical protein